MNNNSIFCVSLDFELHWGGFEKWAPDDYYDYFIATREIIPKILKAFERSNVHCTWATVGLLLNNNSKELEKNIPDIKPTYNQKNLSAYEYINSKKIGKDELDDPLHYGNDLILKIIKTRGQELGSHSFAHYYCNEPGQNPDQFRADAEAWNTAAKKHNICAKSLVFPRNQFNSEYLEVCADLGIQIVRTNPVDWWWQIESTQNESKWKRLNRGLDAYFNFGGKTSFALSSVQKEANVWLLPASRLLRPYNPKELFLNNKKINRIKNEMTLAASQNECYHLWWHPHNFGRYPKQSMDGLVEILNHYQQLHKDYNMISLNMGELADLLSGKTSNN